MENFEEWFNAPFADKCDVSLTDEEELLVIRRLHHVGLGLLITNIHFCHAYLVFIAPLQMHLLLPLFNAFDCF